MREGDRRGGGMRAEGGLVRKGDVGGREGEGDGEGRGKVGERRGREGECEEMGGMWGEGKAMEILREEVGKEGMREGGRREGKISKIIHAQIKQGDRHFHLCRTLICI